ncbi:potassium transporter [Marinobacterium nitratireducens]|uniref:Potassium transporter n=1 Tax=Marinobacterium nitratireducens TaxID=518897 RepID=A0A917ZHE4_9GAMM|nr:monovalent cation:proton antiporter family protein [Marinobacterium nitratireducens]GGO83046.1 potassium transporter [Marinobacterium nitratireducens]
MEHGFFQQFLTIIASAVVAITLFRRVRLPPILAYLSVGVLLGPYSLGVVDNDAGIHLLSELGVVFLLFMLGLEFSLPRMIAMRRTVFGLGSMQVILTAALIMLAAWALDLPFATSLVIAGALALSSTAIVTRELIRRNEINATHGRLSVGILIFQDLAAVFFLIVVPTLGGSQQQLDSREVVTMLLQGSALLVALLVFGRTVLPMLFNEVAKSRSDELFVLTTLVAALAAAWLTHAAGLSMALGGFLAGMMLGESRYRHQLEADIRPFRDVLLGLFFVSVGMQLDLNALVAHIHWVLAATLALLLVKAGLIMLSAWLLHGDAANSLRAGICLAQGGEFGFALLALALNHQLVSSELHALVVAVIIFSMLATPILIRYSEALSRLLMRYSRSSRQTDSLPHPGNELEDISDHVILCGYGRVGQVIARFLRPLEIPYVIIDNDPLRVQEAAMAGERIFYGDARRTDLLKSLGSERARLMILTFPDDADALKALQGLKHHFPDLPVLVRTRDDGRLEQLQQAGATEVIPEALEGSLMLVSHVLTLLDVPERAIEARIGQVRQERYRLLHGYYHGGQSSKLDKHGAPAEVLHPVILAPGSHAPGHSLGELELAVEVESIRRDQELLSAPGAETRLQDNDIVILRGTVREVEKAEALLLAG